jgi:hypothetical protein
MESASQAKTSDDLAILLDDLACRFDEQGSLFDVLGSLHLPSLSPILENQLACQLN